MKPVEHLRAAVAIEQPLHVPSSSVMRGLGQGLACGAIKGAIDVRDNGDIAEFLSHSEALENRPL